jgi:hypothetical protein
MAAINMKVCQVLPKFYTAVFVLFALVPLLEDAGAQSRWSEDANANNSIVDHSSSQVSPAIASDGQRGAIIVWVDGRSGNADLYGMRIDLSGRLRWTTGGIPIAAAPNEQSSPTVIERDTGGVFIAWQDNRNDASVKEIFVHRINNNGEGIGFFPTAALQGNNRPPLILRNGVPAVIAAAFNTNFPHNTLSFQILDEDGLRSFNPQIIVNETARGSQLDQPPPVAPALNGGIIAAWRDSRTDTSVYVIGLNSAGVPWGLGEISVGPNIVSSTSPAIVSDGIEGAIVVWIQKDAVDNDNLRATRVNATGGVVWNQDIPTSIGKKRQLKVASDGANGAFIIWETRVDTNSHIYAQRILNDGSSWIADSSAALMPISNQTNAKIIGNGNGDAIVVWQDDRNLATGIDLYGQRFSPVGARRWRSEVAVTTAPNDQQKPVLTTDGLGGAIIAWEDSRNANSDIFAQRVSITGALGEFRTVGVAAPAEGDNWEIGSTQTIRWAATANEITNVQIELSRNGGQDYEVIVNSVANTNPTNNTVNYTVNGDATNNAIVRIRVRDLNATFISDSSATFVISEPQGPDVTPTQVASDTAGTPLVITTNATDLSGVQRVDLNYKAGGARAFQQVQMTSAGNNQFRGVIPSNMVTERGVHYFIRATDVVGASTNSNTFFVNVNFPSETETVDVGRGSSQNAYRMFSAPNILDQPSATNIFMISNFGDYDTTSWRLFQFRDTSYVEFDTLAVGPTFQFTPGEAYWLISARDRTINFGSGSSRPATQNASVTLQPGWNQLGNPFAFPVAWDTVMTASGNPPLNNPYSFSGSFDTTNVIRPYEGYFVFNNAATPVTLNFPPVERAGAGSAKTPAIASADWEVQIVAECQNARDHFNLLGIHSRAAQEWDLLDYPEPPPIGEYVSVAFPRNDWETHPNVYTTDFRQELGEGQTWVFRVRSNIAGAQARLHFDKLESLPDNLEIWLVDELLNIKQDVRRENSFVVPTGSRGTSKTLKLVIGSTNYLASELSSGDFIPETFELHQNFPNPFNPVTAIRYGIPQAAKVTLKIYDLLGREVATVIDNENKQPGFHLTTWNGIDKHGRNVASGVYIYRIIAGSFVQSRKMVFVK